jgi:hypothetical protein
MMAFSPHYLETTGLDDRDGWDRRQAVDPDAAPVESSNFFSCRLTLQQPSKDWKPLESRRNSQN